MKTTFWYFPWQPGAILAVARLPPYERGIMSMMADDYWLSQGTDFDLDPEALSDRLDLLDDLTPYIPRICKAWPKMKAYLDDKLAAKIQTSETNRNNVLKRYTGQPEKEPFDHKLHESKDIWPIWLNIQNTFPGDRIKPEDFLLFESTINKGVDPQLIYSQAKLYSDNKADGFGGLSFTKFLKQELYNNNFKPKSSNKLARCNDAGVDELISKMNGDNP